MKKILFGLITSLILISTTLYAACTTTVDMGDNFIKGLKAADGTDDTHAVNYEQTLKVSEADVIMSNTTKVDSLDTTTWKVRVRKVGKLVCLSGILATQTSDLNSSMSPVFRIPAGYTPTRNVSYAIATLTTGEIYNGWCSSGGACTLEGVTGNPIPANQQLRLSTCWVTN